MSAFARFLRLRPKRKPRVEPAHFDALKARSDAEWTAALNENPQEAERWIYAAAVAGNPDAQLYYGQMLLDGYSRKRDEEGAFRWFEIASRSGHAAALNMVGRCHERGWGVPPDPAKAAACYRDAAEKDDAWARFNLACLLLSGRGVATDPQNAFILFMKAASQQHSKSFNMVGRCYEEGLGVARDMTAALQWYRRSAQSGDFRGQYRYGQLLYESGLRKDAAVWIARAVESAPGQFCREFSLALSGQPDPILDEIGRHAQARADAFEKTQQAEAAEVRA